MKYLQRYCLLLCALVMCVGLFSITAHAKALDFPAFNVSQYVTATHGDFYEFKSFSFTPRNGSTETQPYYTPKRLQSNSTQLTINNTLHFEPLDSDIFIKCDGKITLTMKNTQITYLLCDSSGKCSQYYEPTTSRVLLFYSDGSFEYIDNVTYENIRNFTITFTPKKDVASFELITTKVFTPANGQYFQGGAYFGEHYYGDDGYEMFLDVENEETGLLKGIIGWLQGIKDGITNLFNSIAELPSKLWDKISEGLKSLFVPSEDSMTAYKDKWDELLSSRLGAVYQVGDIVTNSWDSVMNADQTNTIEFPGATINLPGDAQFTFGGYDVKIVPDGFDFLVTAIKIIVGIVCTLAFINGMLKRYDEVMGVEN